MNVQLRYFASVREAMGRSEELFECSVGTVGQLRDVLLARGGVSADALARSRPLRVALNQMLCDESAQLQDGCEVAFFPPVTGG